jgi:peptide/nickel transport system ATP-binding protein
MIAVEDLTIEYDTVSGPLRAVSGVSFALGRSEILGIVGESGSGKSTLAMAFLDHVAGSGRVAAGRILFEGADLLALAPTLRNAYRGKRIGFVPQNPATGLSPNLRIGAQYTELVRQHRVVLTAEEARQHATTDLALVGLPSPENLLRRYPHELSGGQQQRVCIAMAIACRPRLLILDEPTTGLDVTTQVRIIDLLKDLRSRFGMAMLYVTHDLGLLAQIADRVGVMYAGRLIEIAPAERLFAAPIHPYTRALIASAPSLDEHPAGARRLRGLLERSKLPPGCPFAPRCDFAEASCSEYQQCLEPVASDHAVACQRWRLVDTNLAAPPYERRHPPRREPEPLLELASVSLAYRKQALFGRINNRESATVVDDLSLTIHKSEIFALVGESGSGKSTIARAIAGLLAPAEGEMRFAGRALPGRLRDRPLALKRSIQYVFQNPDASLNPRERILSGLARPLRLYFRGLNTSIPARVADALREVRLDPSYSVRFPLELSGGERQRIAIARGLIAEPSLILCDEVLSALDVSVQASVLDLLARLRAETGVAMLFISHDLAVVRHLADRTAVLFRGRIMEMGRTEELFEPPFHPYTEELLLALPAFRKRLRKPPALRSARGGTPSRDGCAFASRCPYHLGPVCDDVPPPWRKSASGHVIRCHIALPELGELNLVSAESAPRAETAGKKEDGLVERSA